MVDNKLNFTWVWGVHKILLFPFIVNVADLNVYIMINLKTD